LLQDRTSIEATVVSTDVDNLRFVPFGDRRLARNPIAPGSVSALLSQLHQDCRYVVMAAGIETSKLLAMLSRASDGTYLIVQLGAAQRQDTSALADFLSRAGARLLGCIATSAA
jgi:Mrp family chromosome partitioning ATPase